MRLRIIQGGQRGVDRGAWRGAVECELERGGWAPHDMRDENGPMPDEVMADLKPCAARGYPARTRANVAMSDAVVVVREKPGLEWSRGSWLTWRLANGKPRRVVDCPRSLRALGPWLLREMECARLVADRDFNLMIAGPRASIWPEGEDVARRVVHEIAKSVC